MRSLDILWNTPWWVWVILVVLLVTGVQALKPRVVAVWRPVIVPVFFIAWGILSVVQRSGAAHALVLTWIVGAVIGAAIGWATTSQSGFAFEADGRSVRLAGSALQLARNLVVFIAKYTLAVATAFAVTAASRSQLAVWDVAVSGLAAGYFLGWLARFANARRARTSTA